MSPLSPFRLSSALALASLCCCAALAHPARAQVAPTASADRTPLPIALPDGAKLQTELNGSDTDILGMVKGLLAGVADPATADAAAPKKTAPAKDDASADGPPWMKIFSDGQLTELLKNIHHLHFVAYNLPTVAPGVGTAPGNDVVSFCEKPLQAAGGHRLLWQGGDPQVLIESEGTEADKPAFTAVYHSGANVFVVRADGYPDMKVVGSLLRTFLSGDSDTPNKDATPATPPPATKPTMPAPAKKPVKKAGS